jgi:hypothetical protein
MCVAQHVFRVRQPPSFFNFPARNETVVDVTAGGAFGNSSVSIQIAGIEELAPTVSVVDHEIRDVDAIARRELDREAQPRNDVVVDI